MSLTTKKLSILMIMLLSLSLAIVLIPMYCNKYRYLGEDGVTAFLDTTGVLNINGLDCTGIVALNNG